MDYRVLVVTNAFPIKSMADLLPFIAKMRDTSLEKVYSVQGRRKRGAELGI